MKAGHELDALVAEKVFGGELVFSKRWEYWDDPPARRWVLRLAGRTIISEEHWSPSRNIADAWQVVEKMDEMGWSCGIVRRTEGKCVCEFWGHDTWPGGVGKIYYPSVAVAICLAALKAIEHE